MSFKKQVRKGFGQALGWGLALGIGYGCVIIFALIFEGDYQFGSFHLNSNVSTPDEAMEIIEQIKDTIK